MKSELNRATFFVNDGKSIATLMREREYSFNSPSEWRSAVRRRIRGADLALTTADGRTLDAMWSSRHCSARGPQALETYLSGASSSSSSDEGRSSNSNSDRRGCGVGGFGATRGLRTSAGLPRSAVLLFHANAQIGLDLCEWARWYAFHFSRAS